MMATVQREARFDTPADAAWARLRDVGAAHKLFPGVLVDSRLDGDTRTVTFANGMVAKERIVTIDDSERRLVYSVVDGAPTHHNASMQIFEDGPDGCRFVWISDFLPDEFGNVVEPLVAQGVAAL